MGKRSSYDSILGGNTTLAASLFQSLASDEQTLRLVIDQIAAQGNWAINRKLMNSARFGGYVSGDGSISVESNILIESFVTSAENTEDLWGAVLARLYDYAIDLVLSQTRSADLLVSPEVGDIGTMRVDLSIQRGLRSLESISHFEEFALRRGGVLGAAYSAGLVSFEKAFRIIDEAERFREWLSDLPPDTDIITEYHAAVTRGTVLETLAGRAVRFAFVTGGGLMAGLVSAEAGLAAGASLGAFDTFVLDRIAKGWRPNAFIDELKRRLPHGDHD